MNLLLALAKAALWGGGLGRTGQGSSLHHTQQMGSGHVQPLHQDWSGFAALFCCNWGLQGYISQCAEAWIHFASDQFSPRELSCIRKSPLVIQVQLENITTSVNGETLISWGCRIQKHPYRVHRSGRARLL